MSAWLTPVCGRASTRLSIFTASTGRGPGTGSPVKGDRSPGDTLGEDPVPAPGPEPALRISPTVTPADATTAAETPAMILTRVRICAPAQLGPQQRNRRRLPPATWPCKA